MTNHTVLILPFQEVRQDPPDVVVVVYLQLHAVRLCFHPPDVLGRASQEPVRWPTDALLPEHSGHGARPPREAHHGVAPQPRDGEPQERCEYREQNGGRHRLMVVIDPALVLCAVRCLCELVKLATVYRVVLDLDHGLMEDVVLLAK